MPVEDFIIECLEKIYNRCDITEDNVELLIIIANSKVPDELLPYGLYDTFSKKLISILSDIIGLEDFVKQYNISIQTFIECVIISHQYISINYLMPIILHYKIRIRSKAIKYWIICNQKIRNLDFINDIFISYLIHYLEDFDELIEFLENVKIAHKENILKKLYKSKYTHMMNHDLDEYYKMLDNSDIVKIKPYKLPNCLSKNDFYFTTLESKIGNSIYLYILPIDVKIIKKLDNELHVCRIDKYYMKHKGEFDIKKLISNYSDLYDTLFYTTNAVYELYLNNKDTILNIYNNKLYITNQYEIKEVPYLNWHNKISQNTLLLIAISKKPNIFHAPKLEFSFNY